MNGTDNKNTNSYITIYFGYGLYTNHKTKIKSIANKHGLRWDNSKEIKLTAVQTYEVYEFFKQEDKINNDVNLKGRSSSSGIWMNSITGEALKIIGFEKRSSTEHLPIMLIYRGREGEFSTELLEYCIPLGCEIGKAIDIDGKIELVYKRRLQAEENETNISCHEDLIVNKEVMKSNFLGRVMEVNRHKNEQEKYSTAFIAGWQKLIDKYGLYSYKMLSDELEAVKTKVEVPKDDPLREEISKMVGKRKVRSKKEKKES